MHISAVLYLLLSALTVLQSTCAWVHAANHLDSAAPRAGSQEAGNSLRQAAEAAQATGIGLVAPGVLHGSENCGVTLDLGAAASDGLSTVKLHGHGQQGSNTRATIIDCSASSGHSPSRILTVMCSRNPVGGPACSNLVLSDMTLQASSSPISVSNLLRQQVSLLRNQGLPIKEIESQFQSGGQLPAWVTSSTGSDSNREDHSDEDHYSAHSMVANRLGPFHTVQNLYNSNSARPERVGSMEMKATMRSDGIMWDPVDFGRAPGASSGGCVLVLLPGNTNVSLSNIGVQNCSAVHGGGISILEDEEGSGQLAISSRAAWVHITGMRAENCIATQGGGLYVATSARVSLSDVQAINCSAVSDFPVKYETYDVHYSLSNNTGAAAGAAILSVNVHFANGLHARGSVTLASAKSSFQEFGAEGQVVLSGPRCLGVFTFGRLNGSSISNVTVLDSVVFENSTFGFIMGGGLSISEMLHSSIQAVTVTNVNAAALGNFTAADGGCMFVFQAVHSKIHGLACSDSSFSVYGLGSSTAGSGVVAFASTNITLSRLKIQGMKATVFGTGTRAYGTGIVMLLSNVLGPNLPDVNRGNPAQVFLQDVELSNIMQQAYVSIVDRDEYKSGTGSTHPGTLGEMQGGALWVAVPLSAENINIQNVSCVTAGYTVQGCTMALLTTEVFSGGVRESSRTDAVMRNINVQNVVVKGRDLRIQGGVLCTIDAGSSVTNLTVQDVALQVTATRAPVSVQGLMSFCAQASANITQGFATGIVADAEAIQGQGVGMSVMTECDAFVNDFDLHVSLILRSENSSMTGVLTSIFGRSFVLGGQWHIAISGSTLGKVRGSLYAIVDQSSVTDGWNCGNCTSPPSKVPEGQFNGTKFTAYYEGVPAFNNCSVADAIVGSDIITLGHTYTAIGARTVLPPLRCGIPIFIGTQVGQTLEAQAREGANPYSDSNADLSLFYKLNKCASGTWPTAIAILGSFDGVAFRRSLRWPHTPVVDSVLQAFLSAQAVCSPCAAGTYSISPAQFSIQGISSCLACPFGAQCPGASEVKAISSFWGYANASAQNASHSLADRFILCPRGICSPSDDAVLWNGDKRCGNGRVGVMCGGCAPGMGRAFLTQDCVTEQECANSQPYTWPILLVGGFGYTSLVLLASVHSSSGGGSARDRLSDVVFIVAVPFYQFASLVLLQFDWQSLSTNVQHASSAVSAFAWASPHFMSTQSLTAKERDGTAMILCPLSGLSTQSLLGLQWILYALLPFQLYVCGRLIPPLLKWISQNPIFSAAVVQHKNIEPSQVTSETSSRSEPDHQSANMVSRSLRRSIISKTATQATSQLGRVYMALFRVVFTGLAGLTSQMLSCRKIPDLVANSTGENGHSQWRWWFNGEVECLQSWQSVAIFVMVLLLLLPSFLVYFFSRQEAMSQAELKNSISGSIGWQASALQEYRRIFKQTPVAKHWTAVQLYFKLLLAAVVYQIPEPFVRALTAALLVLLFLIAETGVRPFASRALEQCQLVASALLLGLALLQLRVATLQSRGLGSSLKDSTEGSSSTKSMRGQQHDLQVLDQSLTLVCFSLPAVAVSIVLLKRACSALALRASLGLQNQLKRKGKAAVKRQVPHLLEDL